MDEVTFKTLKRVCLQFKTGIRKPFVVDGVRYKLSLVSMWADDSKETTIVCELLDRDFTPTGYSWFYVQDATPDAILMAINEHIVCGVIES